jgi:hypothetical protein
LRNWRNKGLGNKWIQNLSAPARKEVKMAKLLWQPSEERIKNSNMYRFMNVINEKYNKDFSEIYGPLGMVH